jgi:hypothetical protein
VVEEPSHQLASGHGTILIDEGDNLGLAVA